MYIARSHYKKSKGMFLLLLGRLSGMAERMPFSNKATFNDESIAVQIIFLDVYTWN